MTFTQRRDYDAFELSYTLKYDLVKSKKAICGTLTVDAGEKWNKLVASPNYNFVNDIEGNLKLDTKRNSRYTFDVQIQYPNKKEAGKILLDIADVGEHNYETLHIKNT